MVKTLLFSDIAGYCSAKYLTAQDVAPKQEKVVALLSDNTQLKLVWKNANHDTQNFNKILYSCAG